MKILILKLGVLMFAFSLIVGTYREMPVFTVVWRSFVAFLAVEGVLVLMAYVVIKATEQMRTDSEDDYEEDIE